MQLPKNKYFGSSKNKKFHYIKLNMFNFSDKEDDGMVEKSEF